MPMRFSLINKVFPKDFMEGLISKSRNSKELRYHLSVLRSRYGLFLDTNKRCLNIEDLARKITWEKYLRSANRNGFLEIDNGEIVSRLKELEGDNFRSALAECIVCWFFDKQLAAQVSPYPAGRKGKVLDMLVMLNNTGVGVEAKSPFRATPQGAWTGDDTDLIQKSLNNANRQFTDDRPNILALVPFLRTRLFNDRHPLINALLGKEVITFDVDKKSGSVVSELRNDFVLDGKFTKPLKPDHSPGYTRISAVLVIEQSYASKSFAILGKYFTLWQRVTHNILVLHNPFSKFSLSPKLFKRWPQLVRGNGYMRWTDHK